MKFLRNVGAALVASCFVASSASAVTVTNKAVLEGQGAVGVTITFDIDETQTTRSKIGGSFGQLYTNSSQVDAGTHISWSDNPELAQYFGTQFQYTNLTLTYDADGQIVNYGDGIGEFEVFERKTFDATYSRYESQFWIPSLPSYDEMTFGFADQNVPLSTDFSSQVLNIASAQMAPRFGNFFVGKNLVSSAFSVSQSAGTKPPLPQPPISAVPVPAPFLMLGVAFVGLLGFGRRGRA